MPQRVAWSPDGTEIAVSDPRCKAVRVFSAEGKHLRLIGPSAPWFALLENPMGVAYSPDGANIAVTDMENHRVGLFTRSGAFVALLRSNADRDDPKIREPWDVACSPDGEIIALNSGRLYDKTGKFLRALGAGGVAVSFFPDGKSLAIVNCVGTPRVKVVDLQGVTLGAFGTPMRPGQDKVPGLIHHPMGISCSPDGKTVAIADERQNRLLFFSAQGAHLESWDGHGGTGPEEFGFPRGIAFSPDGSKLALADARNERVMVFTRGR
jgi:DNA-binding beta-propeller fold protein YncE